MKRLLPLVLLAASCGVGGALAGAAGGGGGGGGGSNPPPPPFVLVAVPGGAVSSNLVPVTYILRDPQVRARGAGDRPGGEDDPRVRVRPQWEPPDAPDVWVDMTEADVAGSDGTRALALGQHTFVWNTLTDLAGYRAATSFRVRVLAEYEETAGFRRTFRIREARFRIDERLAGTIFGAEAQPGSDVLTFPVDLRPDGDGFVVADFGANIVERVDENGIVRRLLGFGVPGDTVGSGAAGGKSPGVARLQTLIGVELDGSGNLYTNHSSSLLVTNRTGAAIRFGAVPVPPFTVVRGATGLSGSRDVRFHPSGALLFVDQAKFVLAVNPQDPANPLSGPITLAGVEIAPGFAEVLAGGGSTDADGAAGTDTILEGAVGVAPGPDGEIYWVEQTRSRVRVLNTGTTDLTVGLATVAPGAVRTVAGTGFSGFTGDGGPAAAAELSSPTAIDVSADRVLFVADAGNRRVRAANLGAADVVTLAETDVAKGEIETVVGGGNGGVGSKASATGLGNPNALSLDANGNLLVSDDRTVLLVNVGTATVTSYGKTVGGARTTLVYDATRRGGVPLLEPRAVHASSSTEVFFSDRTTVRVLNLATTDRVFGGEAARGGGTTIVGGGAVPGFSGDGGSARDAAFAFPSGLAAQGRLRLFVADTGNDRVRLVNLGDPRFLPPFETDTYLTQVIAPGNVATVVGGGPGPGPGDGGPAGLASLVAPEGVAVGPDGLLWIADTGAHRIRVVNPGGTAATVAGVSVAPGAIETIAGDGTPAFSADGPVVPGATRLNAPAALTLDNAGILYFAERGNSRIRCINPGTTDVTRAGITIPAGGMRTLVGSGVQGNTGDGGDGPSARIDSPRGLFVQSRTDGTPVGLLFSDETQHVVRALNLSETDDLVLALDERGDPSVTIPAATVLTVAGGPNTFGVPNPPAFSGDGSPAADVRFNGPSGIAVTVVSGVAVHLFVADLKNDRLRRFGASPLTTPE